MKEQEQRLKIAIQKSGRLTENSMDLLRSCGLNFEFQGRRLKAEASNFPADILLLKDDDIPSYVKIGDADLGIVGENLLLEYEPKVDTIMRLDCLGFEKCKCSLTVGVSINSDIQELSQLEGALIMSSLPRRTKKIFSKRGISVRTRKMDGSVELGIDRKGVRAITDITQTGDTMIANGVTPFQKLEDYEPVLIANPRSYRNKGSRRIIDNLTFRISQVLMGKNLNQTPSLPEIEFNFDKLKDPLNEVYIIPAIIQDAETKDVRMLGFMDNEAYQLSRLLGEVVFWSRTEKRLWLKGETSGNRLVIQRWFADCDNDSLLIFVNALGPTCHRGTDSCFDQV